MPGAAISGKDGDVKIASTSVSEVGAWTFNPKANTVKYASNKTGGYKRAVAGVKDATGTANCKFDPATLPTASLAEGTGVTLLLYLNATLYYSVPSVIDDLRYNVDIDGGEIVSFDVNFSSNGAWTNPTASMTLPDGYLAQEAPAAAPMITPEVLAQITAAATQAVLAALNASAPAGAEEVAAEA